MNRWTTTSADETIRLGESFASHLLRGSVVALYGDLGAGKTQFVKGVCRAFGVRTAVSSPTFVLLNRYDGVGHDGGEILLYHLDCYRVTSLNEIYDIGYEEIINGNEICLIEWAEKVEGLLPERRYDVRFEYGPEEHQRLIRVTRTPEGIA